MNIQLSPTSRATKPKIALAIGNFDGVHHGHQALFATLRTHAPELALSVLSFHPHPVQYFRPDAAPPVIYPRREKFLALQAAGVQNVFHWHFGKKLANCTPEKFFEYYLCEILNVGAICVGVDFRFGAGRAGDFALLEKLGEKHGVLVLAAPTVLIENNINQKLSSSQIRAWLKSGNLNQFYENSGRKYALSGRVIHGQQLGRTLGFPTANIPFPEKMALPFGIYAVRVTDLNNKNILNKKPAVASFGNRPTVNGKAVWLEVFIPDFAGNLYGQRLEIIFENYLRPELKFDNLDELIIQMKIDTAQALAVV